MAQVTVKINGRQYDISCNDGEEAHVTLLSEYVNRRVAELVANVRQVGDARLLVMASLLIADELSEVSAELSEVEKKETEVAQNAPGAADFELMVSRIESIAEKLEDN